MADTFTPPSSFYDTIKRFPDVEKLTKWANDNLLLQHQYVIDRLATLLTCMECNLKFPSQNDLVQQINRNTEVIYTRILSQADGMCVKTRTESETTFYSIEPPHVQYARVVSTILITYLE